MGIITKLKELVSQRPDPYQYECTVCERSFQSKRSTCPDCGGDVERSTQSTSPAPADSHP